jgi:bifunctional DNase/RNase
LKEVIIDQFKQGVFHAKLVCVQNNTESLIDSRTSDAVALAIRFRCPIYTYEKIMSEAGMNMDENIAPSETMTRPAAASQETSFDEFTQSELEEMLQKAIDQEDYEKASLIRDEIKKRKKE